MAGLATREGISIARQRIAQLTGHGGARDSADGKESLVMSAIEELGAGWERIDDIQWPGYEFANVDHVLVGPAGVFVIDLKRGPFDLGETPTKRDQPTPEAIVKDIVSAAHAVGSLIGMVHRRPMALLCLVDEPGVETTVGDALVCSIDLLVPRLQGMAPILDADQVRDLADKLRKDLVLVTGRLAALPRQRSWAPDPGSVFELDALDESPNAGRRRIAALIGAAAITLGVAGYAVVHIDDAFKGSGSGTHQQQRPADDVKPGKGDNQKNN